MKTKTDSEHSILCQSIWTLPMSDEFKIATSIQGYETLNDMLQKTTWENEKLAGFHVQLIHEYISFLEVNGLGPLIDLY